jgi:ribosomal protein L34
VSRFKYGNYGDGLPAHWPSIARRMFRRSNRVVTSFDGLRQMSIEVGKESIRTPHGRKVLAQRRAANKVARASRKRNRS